MFILILFAFIAGIVTILSPCILPILPIVLSGGVTGGKKRPLGVITGFIISFTFFTLFLSAIVRVTGVSADILRTISVVIVAIFGIALLLPQFQVMLEQLFSKLAGSVSGVQAKAQSVKSDYLAGVLIGVSLGLVWTPCVGPILASVITLAATSSVSFGAILMTLAYSIGTAIPLFAITYGGRELLQKHPWLLSNSRKIQQVFGVLMLLTALAIFFNIDRKFQTYILEKFPQYGVGLTQIEDNQVVRNALENINNEPMDETKIGKPMSDVVKTDLGAAPEFILGGQWFNLPAGEAGTEPLTMTGLRGKVVLVDFWTYTCINCIRTLPYLKSWHERYADKGLVIVGVHTPEFAFEKEADNVEKAIADFEIKYPVMQDNDYATWRAYNNRFWPAKYLIDKDGRIRYTHFGEGKYDETEEMIQELLGEIGTEIDMPISNPTYDVKTRTPETYLGYARMQYIATPDQVRPDESSTYTAPQQLNLNTFAFSGTWTVGDEYAMADAGSSLSLRFEAQEVFLVMRPTGATPARVRVLLDNQAVTTNAGEDVVNGVVTVDTDRLYKLIKLPNPEQHTIQLEFLDGSVEVFAFTFG
ncbi:cytochrome c biogenesis protein DipZ [Candidatus Microgenomates bacterium]|nr:MAG: cytochrome c biogenesis protein DipZ [Candidatus Microgenomates bacterium]